MSDAKPHTREEMMRFMQEAIGQARKSLNEGGIPIGSVLVRNGEVIARGHNRRVQNGDPTAHAEIDCLRNAGRIGRYDNTVLYSTLMPCSMCAGATILFQIPIVVAGEDRTFMSARAWLKSKNLCVVDLNLDECYDMMQGFIKAKPELWNEDIGTV